MPTATIYFSDKEDKKISHLSKLWNIAKYEVIKKLIREYKIKGNKKNDKFL